MRAAGANTRRRGTPQARPENQDYQEDRTGAEMKKRYVSASGHTSEGLGLYFARGDKSHNYEAYHNGKDVFSSQWRAYSPAHRIVRARRIACAVLYFVELQQEQK
jgi:hypothetical protein